MLRKVLVSMILLVLGCSSEYGNTESADGELLQDVLTLEWTIGGENDPLLADSTYSQYLLARPQSIAVTNNNELLVFDEDIIKVFDEDGKPKLIAGAVGEGPNEYPARMRQLNVGPSGFVSLIGGGFGDTYISMSSDFQIIEKIPFFQNRDLLTSLFETIGARPSRPRWGIALNQTDNIVVFDASSGSFTDDNYDVLVLLTENRKSIIASYKQTDRISSEFGSGTSGDFRLGSFFISSLPGNRIVYTQSYLESEVVNNEGTYNLIVVNVDDPSSKRVISHSYDPVPFPEDEERRTAAPTADERTKNAMEDIANQREQIVKERRFQAPILNVITDRHYIFVFRTLRELPENPVTMEVTADVFDADLGRHIATVSFSQYPEIIKNGFAYKFTRAFGGNFAEITKYRIDPAVYGK